MVKNGFSLIELIISIIIIGITSMAIPLIISISSTQNNMSITSESIKNTKAALVFIIKSPYTCAYIKDHKNASVPIFTKLQNNENFYAKHNIKAQNRRNFVDISIYNNQSCENITSIDSYAGSYKMDINENSSGDFLQNLNYQVSIDHTSKPFDENILDLNNIDTKIITINAQTKNQKGVQNIKFYAIATNIGELDSLLTKEFN